LRLGWSVGCRETPVDRRHRADEWAGPMVGVKVGLPGQLMRADRQMWFSGWYWS